MTHRTNLLLLWSLLPICFTQLACGPKTEVQNPSPEATQVQPVEPVAVGRKAPEPPALLASALADDPMAVTIHRLSNGLSVYISTDRSTPSISSWIAVRSGSRHDPADSTGLAHYLEHMLFKGSGEMGTLDFSKEKPHLDRIAALYDDLKGASNPEARGKILTEIDSETQESSQYSVPNEFDNLYASLGIDGVNAFTGDEQTVYIANVPSNRFEVWTQVEGERFSDPQFRLFYPELESVYEEKNRSLDSAGSRMFEALGKALFPAHPYGTQPTLGLSEHLKTPAYGDMVQYFDTWYRPNNMAIILAGDIDAERALPALELAFGGLKAQPLPDLPPASTQASTTRQEIEVVAPGEQSVMIAWPTVAAGHEDETALDAMDLLVDNHATGLLNLDLVLSQKLPGAGSFGRQQTDAGIWVLSGTARESQTHAQVEALLMGVVEKLKAGRFSQSDLDAIVVNSEISNKKKLESNSARVEMMASAFIERRAWSDVTKRQERLRAVQRDDVMRVAAQYLTDAPVIVKRVSGEFVAPKVKKPSITAIKIDSSKESPYAKKIASLPVKNLEPEWLVDGNHYQASQLPAGPLVTVANERNDLFTLSYRFDVGEEHEPLFCFALDLVERSGAAKRNPQDLQKTLYAMGSSIYFSCGSKETKLTITGVDRSMEASIALLTQWLASPKVEAEALSKLLANTISRRKDAMEEPRVIAAALSEYALYGKASSYLNVASNDQLRATNVAQLTALVSSLLTSKHQTSYFGPRAREGLSKVVALGHDHKALKKRSPLRYQKHKKSTLYFVDQKVTQAQVRIAFPSGVLRVKDKTKVNLFNQYVGGGMGGLIFQEIREARGLAYSAWTHVSQGSHKEDHSAIIAGLGTQADKTVEAVTTLLGLLLPLKAEQSRFQTASTSLNADYRKSRIPPRQRAAMVYYWNNLGFAKDPRPANYKELQSATAKAMESFANMRTKATPIFAISGDSSRIDLKALAKSAHIAAIKTLAVHQLFGYPTATK